MKLFKIYYPEGYTYKVMVYVGKEYSSSQSEVTVSDRAVLDLIHQYIDEGRNLVVGNLYTNTAIVKKLFSKKTYLIGTLKKHKRHSKNSFEAYPTFEERRHCLSRTR